MSTWDDKPNDYEHALEIIERLRAALRIFVGCSYPVAIDLNPRGYAWRSQDSLDYALSEAKAVLADQQQTKEQK